MVWFGGERGGGHRSIVRPPPHIRPPANIHIYPHLNAKQALLQNAEIQHRVLEANPLLESFDGFKELKEGGRRLSAEEVGKGLVCVFWVGA